MKHNRSDYDTIQPWPVKRPHIVRDPAGKVHPPLIDDMLTNGEGPIIPDDEPVFLLRSKDPLAAEVVRYWAWLQSRAGADDELVSSCERFADEMQDYYINNYDGKYYADVPDTAELRA